MTDEPAPSSQTPLYAPSAGAAEFAFRSAVESPPPEVDSRPASELSARELYQLHKQAVRWGIFQALLIWSVIAAIATFIIAQVTAHSSSPRYPY